MGKEKGHAQPQNRNTIEKDLDITQNLHNLDKNVVALQKVESSGHWIYPSKKTKDNFRKYICFVYGTVLSRICSKIISLPLMTRKTIVSSLSHSLKILEFF